MLFCILFFSFFGSDRGEYSLADNISAAWIKAATKNHDVWITSFLRVSFFALLISNLHPLIFLYFYIR